MRIHGVRRSRQQSLMQVLPKAVVRMAGCSLDQNRRGKTSGNGVFFDGL